MKPGHTFTIEPMISEGKNNSSFCYGEYFSHLESLCIQLLHTVPTVGRITLHIAHDQIHHWLVERASHFYH